MKNLKNDLEGELPDVMLEASITAKSIVQDRIQETGKDAESVAFRDYAESTKKIRNKKGRQTIFVDLTDTGRMWSNIGVVNVQGSKNISIVSVGGKNEFTKQKLRDNTERFGRIMDLSIMEQQDISQVIDFGVRRIIERNL